MSYKNFIMTTLFARFIENEKMELWPFKLSLYYVIIPSILSYTISRYNAWLIENTVSSCLKPDSAEILLCNAWSIENTAYIIDNISWDLIASLTLLNAITLAVFGLLMTNDDGGNSKDRIKKMKSILVAWIISQVIFLIPSILLFLITKNFSWNFLLNLLTFFFSINSIITICILIFRFSFYQHYKDVITE